MKAIRRLALRDLRFNKTRAIFATILISLPVMAALVVGSLTMISNENWMLSAVGDTDNLQAAGRVSCDCEIRQGPDPATQFHTDQMRPDGDVRELVSAIVSSRNTVEIRAGRVDLMLQRSKEYNTLYGEAQSAIGAEALIVEGDLPRDLDEIALSRSSLEMLGLDVGDTVTRNLPEGTTEVTISGATEQTNLHVPPNDTTRPTLNSLLFNTRGQPEIIVSGPDAVTWEQVKDLNRLGIMVASVDIIADPPPDSEIATWAGTLPGDPVEVNYAGIAIVIVLGVVEVILLISPPFTMAVKRNERTLGQLAAIGATRGQLRRLMLYQGAFFGLAGAALGIAAYSVFRVVIDSVTDEPLPVVAWHYPSVIVVAVLLGLVAALFPAITSSRIDVVAVLTGRESGRVIRRRRHIAGPLFLAVGVSLLLLAPVRLSDWILSMGLIVLILGVIFSAPLFIQMTGWLVARSSLAGKLAGRDAARNIYRSAPGVAAVTIVTMISTFTIAQLATQMDEVFAEEHIAGPRGAVWVHLNNAGAGGDDIARLEEGLVELNKERAIESWTPLYVAGSESTFATAQVPKELQCPLLDEEWMMSLSGDEWNEEMERLRDDPRCAEVESVSERNDQLPYGLQGGYVIVDDGTILALLPHIQDIEKGADTLARGGIVLDSDTAIMDGQATVESVSYPGGGRVVGTSAAVPAATGLAANGPRLVMSFEAAQELGLNFYPLSALVVFERPVNIFESEKLIGIQDENQSVYIAHINEVNTSQVYVALAAAIVSILVAFATAVLIVVLSGREARSDLDTIEALGGRPGLRRRVSIAMGCVVTLAAVVPGIIIGTAFTTILGRLIVGTPLNVPILPVVMLGVLIVVLSCVGAALFAPKQRSLTRRTD